MFCGSGFVPAFCIICCLLIVPSSSKYEVCRSRVYEERVNLTLGNNIPTAMQSYRIYYGEVCDNSKDSECSYIDPSKLRAGYRAVCKQDFLQVRFEVYDYDNRISKTDNVFVPSGCICQLVELD